MRAPANISLWTNPILAVFNGPLVKAHTHRAPVRWTFEMGQREGEIASEPTTPGSAF